MSIVSLHGMKNVALEHAWSVMVSIVSFPSLSGSFVIKSRAIVSNGSALGSVVIGYRGGFGWVVLGLVD